MSELLLRNPCPTCQTKQSVHIHNQLISCQQSTCDFSFAYDCPLCNVGLEDVTFQEDHLGSFFHCSNCRQQIHLKRIQYLIENKLVVDAKERCAYCNGPTVHREVANLGHRCFFFPKCSGQTDIFSAKKDSLVFFDFETSGLEVGKDHITEIGALKIDEDGFEETYETFVNIPVSLSAKIIRLTGITNEMLKDAPTIETVMPEFLAFIGDATLIAHNADFDISWLLVNAKCHEMEVLSKDVICTFKWAQKVGESSCSLGGLTKKYKIGHMNAHRALADAAATKELFFIFDRLQMNNRPLQPIDSYDKIVNKALKKLTLV